MTKIPWHCDKVVMVSAPTTIHHQPGHKYQLDLSDAGGSFSGIAGRVGCQKLCQAEMLLVHRSNYH